MRSDTIEALIYKNKVCIIWGHFYASATSTQYLFTKKSPLF